MQRRNRGKALYIHVNQIKNSSAVIITQSKRQMFLLSQMAYITCDMYIYSNKRKLFVHNM